MAKRFENAKFGDLVYSRMHGDGEIFFSDKNNKNTHPITVTFVNGKKTLGFTVNGCMRETDYEPILFYRNEIDKYLTERPTPPIDWETVEQGTKYRALVYMNDEAYEKDIVFRFFVEDKPWFGEQSHKVISFDRVEIIKEIIGGA